MKGMKSSKVVKIGHRLTAISDLQNGEERVSYQDGNRHLSQKFPERVSSLQVLKNWE